MEDQGVPLNTPSHNAIMKAEILSGSMDGALQQLRIMGESGCKATDRTWLELKRGAILHGRQDVLGVVRLFGPNAPIRQKCHSAKCQKQQL